MAIERNIILLLLMVLGFTLATVFMPSWEMMLVTGVMAVGAIIYIGYYLRSHKIDWIYKRVIKLLTEDGFKCKLEENKSIIVEHKYGELRLDLFETRFRLKRMYVCIRFMNEEMLHLPKEVQDHLLNRANSNHIIAKLWYEDGVISVIYGADAETAEDVVWAFKYGVDRMHDMIDEMMNHVFECAKQHLGEEHKVGFKLNNVDSKDESEK